MKNKLLITAIISTALVLCSCGKNNEESVSTTVAETTTVQETITQSPTTTKIPETTTIANSKYEYKDDFISCTYDSSVLSAFPIPSTEDFSYGLIFIDSITEQIPDVETGTCLYIVTQSLPDSISLELVLDFPEVVAEGLSGGLFGITDTDKFNTFKNSDGTIECSVVLPNLTEYKTKLLNISEEGDFTIVIYRKLSDTNTFYAKALDDCYSSISFVTKNNSSPSLSFEEEWASIEEEASKSVANTIEITSGSLYDSVSQIYRNVELTESNESNESKKLDISIFVDKSSPAEECIKFYSIITELLNTCDFHEYSSILFSFLVEKKYIATIPILDYVDKDTFTSFNFGAVNEMYSESMDDLYKIYFSSYDSSSKLNDKLEDLKQKYNID